MTAPPIYQGVLALILAILPVGVALVYAMQGRLPRLQAAYFLVFWGLFIAVAEHVGFGWAEMGGSRLRTHDGFHFQMLAVYGIAGFTITAVVVAPLIRRGDKLGWYGLLLLVLVGFTAELITAGITTPHGFAPRWWSWGLALWAYPTAWLTALAISWRPIFQSNVR